MSTNSILAKFLRSIGIVLMGLTGGFTLFVITGIALGIYGIRTTIMLIKGANHAYRDALYLLLAGAVIGFGHMDISRMLRGKSMPVDAVVYTTVFTLIIFLLFRIPCIWQGVNFEKGDTRNNLPAGGAAAILLGILTLTIQYTMGATHTWGGVNYADAFNLSMTMIGAGLLLLGAGMFVSMAKVWTSTDGLEVWAEPR